MLFTGQNDRAFKLHDYSVYVENCSSPEFPFLVALLVAEMQCPNSKYSLNRNTLYDRQKVFPRPEIKSATLFERYLSIKLRR